MDIEKIIDEINKDTSRDFGVFKVMLDPLYFEGYQFIGEGENPYEEALHLINSERIHSVYFEDHQKKMTFTLFKEDNFELEIKEVKLEVTDFNMLGTLPDFMLQMGHMIIQVFPLSEVEWTWVHRLKSFSSLKEFLKASTTPFPLKENKEKSTGEIIEEINGSKEKNFNILPYENEDGFYDGFEIEGTMDTDLRTELIVLLENSDLVDGVRYIHGEQNTVVTIVKGKGLKKFYDSIEETFPNPSFPLDETYVILKAYLSIEDLLTFSKYGSFRQVLNYLKEPQERKKSENRYTLRDDEEDDPLPY
ncbi:hypothetical protein QA612_06605 [Evansella sp. AB-P1]|uniref:hypothetical protein n=1 Tax=Evansella sp. AB-P1 TaxID=3037653 RepID=UPI00241DAFE4|nr:hypothetical protein [Evansella sp. AB-P1]MDG5787157.1 hypothetical protein [Evansella sp. AB-P1]